MINNGYTTFNGVFSYISNLLNDIENIKFDKVTSCKFVGKEVKEWKKKIKNNENLINTLWYIKTQCIFHSSKLRKVF